MKNITKFFAIAVVILGFSANSFGQFTNSADGTASATILTALTIESKINLDFGTVYAGTEITNVVLAALDGGRTGGTADLVASGPGAAGEFEIKGEPNALIDITLPNNTDVTLAPTSTAGVVMPVTSWNSLVGASTALTSISLGEGTITLKVGATLTVGVSQIPDVYEGTYEVTVNYQ